MKLNQNLIPKENRQLVSSIKTNDEIKIWWVQMIILHFWRLQVEKWWECNQEIQPWVKLPVDMIQLYKEIVRWEQDQELNNFETNKPNLKKFKFSSWILNKFKFKYLSLRYTYKTTQSPIEHMDRMSGIIVGWYLRSGKLLAGTLWKISQLWENKLDK